MKELLTQILWKRGEGRIVHVDFGAGWHADLFALLFNTDRSYLPCGKLVILFFLFLFFFFSITMRVVHLEGPERSHKQRLRPVYIWTGLS